MSYSRWGSRGSGYWYTYWSCQLGQIEETRDNAIFEICLVCSFTAKELRDNMDKCLKTVEKLEPKASTEQLDELRDYMGEFIIDINKEYKKGRNI